MNITSPKSWYYRHLALILCVTLSSTGCVQRHTRETRVTNPSPQGDQLIKTGSGGFTLVSFTDPRLLKNIERIGIKEDAGLKLANSDDSDNTALIAGAILAGVAIVVAGGVIAYKSMHSPQPRDLPQPAKFSETSAAIPAESPAKQKVTPVDSSPQANKSVEHSSQESRSPVQRGTDQDAGLFRDTGPASPLKSENLPSPRKVSAPSTPQSPEPSPVRPLASEGPEHFEFVQEVKPFTFTDIGSLSFKEGENAILLTLRSDDQLGEQLSRSETHSIVRGTTEFRIHSRSDDGTVVVNAFDLRPKIPSEQVAAAINAGQTYLPQVTFRSDPQFATKQKVVYAFGQQQAIFKLNMGGRVTLADGREASYTVDKLLGQGSYGQVYRVVVNIEGEADLSFAVKQPLSGTLQNKVRSDEQADIIKEVAYLDGMGRHPNSIQSFGAFPVKNGHYSIVMEVVDGDWSKAYSKSSADKTAIMISAADGYAAMHAAHLVHYDTKPANIFVQGNRAKLGDFGYAQKVDDDRIPGVFSHGTYVPKDLIHLSKDGTPGNPYAVDVFTLGLSMVELRLGKRIFPVINSCCLSQTRIGERNVVDGDALSRNIAAELKPPKVVSAEKDLLMRMLSNDASLRPSAAEVATQLRQIHAVAAM